MVLSVEKNKGWFCHLNDNYSKRLCGSTPNFWPYLYTSDPDIDTYANAYPWEKDISDVMP